MNFLQELNEAIGPMLIAEEVPDGGTFMVRLKETPFLDGACLNVSRKFKKTVVRLGEKHFGEEAMFNNTETTWWF